MWQNKNDCSEKLQIVIITLIHWPLPVTGVVLSYLNTYATL